MNDRTRARDSFEMLVVEALIRLADLARDGKQNETAIGAALARAFALVEGWAHYRARVILAQHALEPLARTLREMDAIVLSVTKGEIDGWRPAELPTASAISFRRFCIRCGKRLAVDVQGCDGQSPEVIAEAAGQLARAAGWRVEATRGKLDTIRCPACG